MHLSVARVLIPGRADGGVAGGAGGCAAGAAGWWGLGAGESPQETPPLAGRSLLVAEAGEAVMADYATLLRDHVTLSCRSVDRIFLQAYVPKLQTVGWVCQFLRWQRGYKIPRSAAFGRVGAAYVAEVYRWAEARGVPVVRFAKGENKEEIARPRARANRRSVTGRSPVDTPGA